MQEDQEQKEAQDLQQLVGKDKRPPKQQAKQRPKQQAKQKRGQAAKSTTAEEAPDEDHDLPTSWKSKEGVDYVWAAGPRTNEERGDVVVDKNLLKKGSVVW